MCNNVCRMCNNLVISQEVAFDTATNSLNITIPNNGYRNNEKVCIVVAQAIPTTTTINASVNIVVDGSSFLLVNRNCAPVSACQIRSRTKYSTCVKTTNTSATFKLLNNLCGCNQDTLRVLPITPAPEPTPTAQVVRTRTTTKKGATTNE